MEMLKLMLLLLLRRRRRRVCGLTKGIPTCASGQRNSNIVQPARTPFSPVI